MYRPENPFPFTINSGAVITDERCQCGALRSEHETTIAYGHGPRIQRGKTETIELCSRYTFVGWVFTTRELPNGFEALDDRHAIKVERANKRSVGATGYRYEVRDMSKTKPPGVKVFTCAAPAARSKVQAIAHARIELQRHLERQPELGGVR